MLLKGAWHVEVDPPDTNLNEEFNLTCIDVVRWKA